VGFVAYKTQVFVVAWAGMRGVVSLAAAFGVPMTSLSGAPFPGRPQLVFLTFVVVIGTLLLHGLTLPWLIRWLGVQGDEVLRSVLHGLDLEEATLNRV
jgi:monovalent cation/hydrogen antiporter